MDRPSLTVGRCEIVLKQGDITTMAVDAIVNAANSSLMGGGGVDGAIHRAGGPAIHEECREIVNRKGRLPAGQAVITSGGALPARWVIHTVGPVWRGGTSREAETLASCYTESLKLALEQGLAEVAFPSISTGAYGYPEQKAAPVALNAVRSFLATHEQPRRVYFILYDPSTYQAYAQALESLSTG